MARNKRARITKRDSARLQKLERNVRAKQRRILKNHDINISFDFKDTSKMTRDQLNNYYAKLEKFTSRSQHQFKRVNEDLSVPMNEYLDFRRNVKKANQQRAKVKKKVDAIIKQPRGSEGTGLTPTQAIEGVLGSPKLHFLDKLSGSLAGTHSLGDFRKKADSYRRYANDRFIAHSVEIMRENYAKAITNSERGLITGDNPQKARLLARRIRNMPLEDFYAMYLSEENLDFTYIYNDPDKDAIAEIIDSAITATYRGDFTVDNTTRVGRNKDNYLF